MNLYRYVINFDYLMLICNRYTANEFFTALKEK